MCELVSEIEGFVGNAGLFDVPVLGSILEAIFGTLFSIFDC